MYLITTTKGNIVLQIDIIAPILQLKRLKFTFLQCVKVIIHFLTSLPPYVLIQSKKELTFKLVSTPLSISK